jgi:hypothetical protein
MGCLLLCLLLLLLCLLRLLLLLLLEGKLLSHHGLCLVLTLEGRLVGLFPRWGAPLSRKMNLQDPTLSAAVAAGGAGG